MRLSDLAELREAGKEVVELTDPETATMFCAILEMQPEPANSECVLVCLDEDVLVTLLERARLRDLERV